MTIMLYKLIRLQLLLAKLTIWQSM